MKKTFKQIIYLPLLILLINSGCKKDALTKETQTGANIFSCKINGKVFTPCDDGFDIWNSRSLYGGYNSNFTAVDLTAECNKNTPYKRLTIQLLNFHGVGEYPLSDVNNICTYGERYPDNNYKSTLTRNGKVVITKDDRTNFILSGTFEFTGANTKNTSDIVTISSGRFDIKFI